jgi:adenine-specific DNA-methyltransferase
VAGDSLLVMNSLLKKESMAGQVQMIYIDPPYGIKYGSNFQPFVNKRDVKDRKDEDLTQEPEMIKAFRDTWELGIHSYLTYLRDRLLLARELLHESGSVFVQISDENVHLVRNLLDEIFGTEKFVAVIPFVTTSSQTSVLLPTVCDFIIWYCKDKEKIKYRTLYKDKDKEADNTKYKNFMDENYDQLTLDQAKRKYGEAVSRLKAFRRDTLTSQSGGNNSAFVRLQLSMIEQYKCGYESVHWKTSFEKGMQKPWFQRSASILPTGTLSCISSGTLTTQQQKLNNIWDRSCQRAKFDPILKSVCCRNRNPRIIERCLLMTTDPGDLVLDPTCGSGTTAFVAEKWGRRWIVCDTSRVALPLAKQRLMTSSYDYFELKYPHEGLRGGFIYKTVPHVTLKSIANNPEIDTIYEVMHPAIEQALAALRQAQGTDMQEWDVPFDFPSDWPDKARKPFDDFHAARQAMQKKMDASIAAHADQETLYDQPAISKNKLRITGPFSVEAVPFPTVLSLDEAQQPTEADVSIARSGESHRQHSWRDELLKTGIRGKGGQMLKFTSLETLPGTTCLHCTGTEAETGERVVVSFGPEHGALEQRQVEHALREAGELFPLPKMIVFCAFTFDPEAAKDIDNLKGITALKAQMNTDLLTDDLKKNRASNQSFWLMGQPDVDVRQRKDGLFEVEVNGFDYFNTKTGELEGGGKSKIAVWLLDTDYDERSLLPRQVFFPMAGKGEGWEKLKKNIRAELDDSKLAQFHGTVSLPFEAGENRKIAVKIVDDRGIESLKVIGLPH